MKQKLVKIFHKSIMKLHLENLIIFISSILNLKKWSMLPQNIYYKKNDLKKIISDGVIFNVNRSDFTQWQMYANYPELHFDAFKKIKKGNIIDIGANIGSFSLKVARYFKNNKSNFKVYSFEPYKKIFNILNKNLLLNKEIKENIKLENIAISNKDNQKYLISIVKNNLGANNLKKIKKMNSDVANSISLDSYVFNSKIKNISFIKIDVEGMEIDVLEGAKKVLKKFSPSMFIEINEKVYNKEGRSILPYIRKFKQEGRKFYIEEKKYKPKLIIINYNKLKNLITNNSVNFNLFIN